MLLLRWFSRTLALLVACLGAAAVLAAPVAAVAAEPVVVSTNLDGDEVWLDRRDAVEFRLDRRLGRGEGRLALVLGHIDVSARLRVEGTRVRYRPDLVELSAGESEAVLYRVDRDGGWHELDRRPLRVLARGGFRSASWSPRLDLSIESQLDEDHRPDANEPARHQYLKGGLQASAETRHVWGGVEMTGRGSVVGASFREEALRFGELADDAPRVDLSDYQLDLRRGGSALGFGAGSTGGHRLLVRGLAHRGVRFSQRFGEHVDLHLASVNGTRAVGFKNFSGLSYSDHRLSVAALDVDLPRNPLGDFELQTTWLSGKVQPENGFNSRSVVDAEESRGLGLRLHGRAFADRVRADLGWARSRYDQRDDPQLRFSPGDVEVDAETSSAYYADLEWRALRDLEIGGEKLSLTLRGEHEQVDPLYRTLAAFVRADQRRERLRADLALGAARLRVEGVWKRDNLDDLDTLLTTRTREVAAHLALPLGEWLSGWSGGDSLAWPELAASYRSVHQYGANAPDPARSGFAASSIPDQFDQSADLSLRWSGERVSFGWALALADQDNRQTGRESADTWLYSHRVTLDARPLDWVFADLQLVRTRQRNHELGVTYATHGAAGSLRVEPFEGWSLALAGSVTSNADSDHTRRSRASQVDLEIGRRGAGSPFSRRDDASWRAFVRVSRSAESSDDRVFGVDAGSHSLSLLVGASFEVF